MFQASILERIASAQATDLTPFDLVSGTSTGSIVGLAIAAGIPPRRVRSLFEAHAETIFHPRRARYLRRGGRYNSTRLREALEHEFGDRRLGDLATPVLIPVSVVDTYEGRCFTEADTNLTLTDVALASCAAPTYFSPSTVPGDSRGFIDGGLWANDPSFAALAHAIRYFNVDPAEVRLLSIGTGRMRHGSAAAAAQRRRVASIDTVKALIEATASLQAWNAEDLVKAFLRKEQIVRIDPILPNRIGLDDARAANEQLPALAASEYERHITDLAHLFNEDDLHGDRNVVARPSATYRHDVAEYASDALGLLANAEVKQLSVICHTGGSTINALILRAIERVDDLRLTMVFFDPASSEARWVPAHWPQKVAMNVRRLTDLRREGQEFRFLLHDSTPSVAGTLVGDRHLFFGLTGWDAASGRLRDGEAVHELHHRSPSSEHHFRYFESWLAGPMLRVVPADWLAP